MSHKVWHGKEHPLLSGHECQVYVKIWSPPLVTMTFPFEWKILEWDVNPPNKHKKPMQPYLIHSFFHKLKKATECLLMNSFLSWSLELHFRLVRIAVFIFNQKGVFFKFHYWINYVLYYSKSVLIDIPYGSLYHFPPLYGWNIADTALNAIQSINQSINQWINQSLYHLKYERVWISRQCVCFFVFIQLENFPLI